MSESFRTASQGWLLIRELNLSMFFFDRSRIFLFAVTGGGSGLFGILRNIVIGKWSDISLIRIFEVRYVASRKLVKMLSMIVAVVGVTRVGLFIAGKSRCWTLISLKLLVRRWESDFRRSIFRSPMYNIDLDSSEMLSSLSCSRSLNVEMHEPGRRYIIPIM